MDAVKKIKCKKDHPRIIITDKENPQACQATFDLGFSDCIVINVTSINNLNYTIERNLRDFSITSKSQENLINFNAIVENDYMGIAAFNEFGKVVFSNVTISKMTGYSHEELAKEGLKLVLPSENYDAISKNIVDRFNNKDIPSVYELELISKEKKTIFVEVSAKLTKWGNQLVDLVFFKDITEQRMLRKSLEKNQKLLSSKTYF